MPQPMTQGTPEGGRALRFTHDSGVECAGCDPSGRGGDDEAEYDAQLTG